MYASVTPHEQTCSSDGPQTVRRLRPTPNAAQGVQNLESDDTG